MRKKGNEVEVGVFVIIGFIFLTLVLFFVSGVYLFRPGYSVDVMYEYVSILNKGAPVRMAGVKVGEVDSVQLLYDAAKEKTRVKVKLFIEKGIDIRENYQFTIRGTHILSEPHIEITPVKGSFPILRKGALVEGVSPMPMEALIDRAREISDQLSAILKSVRESVASDGTAKDLKDMIHNLSELSVALNSSLKGSEGDVTRSLKNIQSSSASLDAILGKVNKGEGTLGELLMKDDLYKDMQAFVKDVRAHPWKLLKKDSGQGGRKWYFLFLA
ncbi:MAG TPA: MlaD family protein [Candidatus Omnitrophota bacterium]|nr:MlaD family protein [Candidatus Omnitrophota bacterium]